MVKTHPPSLGPLAMKKKSRLHILMLCEYFPPFDRGGSEWSSLHLAQSLIKRGHRLHVLTPHYGAKFHETRNNLRITRFPFGKKLSSESTTITPFWHTNIVWWLKSIQALFKILSQEKWDLIHLQGKYFLPAAIIAGKIKGIPVVATIRDYQILCPLGFCLWHRKKRCSLGEFLTRDIPTYTQYYQKESSWLFRVASILLHLRLRFVSFLLRLFVRAADQIVVLSQAQKRIFATNGFRRTLVIANTIDSHIAASNNKKDQIIYLGRLTPGKGAHLLIPIFAAAKLKPPTHLLIIGDGFLASRIKEQIKEHHLEKRVTLTGRIDHQQALQALKRSQVALLPSLWPEPFGRTTLEAIFCGCPVVASHMGGPKEIIQNTFGRTAKPTVIDLSLVLKQVLNNETRYRHQIVKHQESLRHEFVTKPVDQYEKLYKRLIAKRHL